MLTQLLAQAVSDYPEKTAIVYDNITISYQELYSKVKGLSKGLNSIGLNQGDCVALLLPNCPEFAIAFYAIANLNAIALPLNHLFKVEEISYYLSDSDVEVIITDSKRAELCRQVLTNFDRAIQLIVVDQYQSPATYFYDLILAESESATVLPTNSNVLYQYSSGSTGRPKRVTRTQENLYHEVRNFAQSAQINSADKIICVVPLYHAHGLGNCLLAAICNGATLVILEQFKQNGVSVEVPLVFKVPRILELLQSEKVTILPGVPYIFKAMAESPASKGADLSMVRLCFSAGNFLDQDVFKGFLERFGIPIRQLYGCTEAGAISINLDENYQETWNSVGIPPQNVEIKIVDEDGEQLAAGTVGEVVIKSPTLTTGYYNLPQVNRQAFKNSMFFTGDLGKCDAEGRLYITGRKKILIDTGGRKVDPVEIEDILSSHSKVKEAVVVGVKEQHSGEIVKAVIVSNQSEKILEQELFSYCQEHLAEFKVPKIVEFRDEIPKSPLGKILRKQLV
ncbi:MAG: class I adenylate-forming enzyme family protein [Cyanobacteria bacterium P01_E01_bin.35]